MKWYREDLKEYLQVKEYIDTIIIPLNAFQFSQESSLEKDAFHWEVLSIYTNEIEKELSGRLLLTPPYSYLKTNHVENEIERLNAWISDVKTQPFEHVFLLTLDNAWKKVEKELNANLLWLPGMKPVNMKSEETVQLIRAQVEQISELIRSYW